jgi:tetratricopeptide (TPR) repeat protein
MLLSVLDLRAGATPVQPRSPRYWRVPPALMRNPGSPELLEGERMLAEHPGDAGLLLWQCYRDVLLWAGTPPEQRVGLFRGPATEQQRELLEAAGLDAETLRAVRTLQRAVRRSSDDGSMASAALAIAAAAEAVGAAATAMGYAQLAAAAVPADAAPALAVGRLAARLGHTAVAESWLRRTIGLARRGEAWECYGWALVALGQLREGAGRLREGRLEYRTALRQARRRGLYETHREAVAGLLRIALREEDQLAAQGYARSVFRMYGRDHSYRGKVLLDVGEMELRRGRHARAAKLLQEALRLRIGTDEQVRALTMLVRAAGGAGERDLLDTAWERALALIDTYGSTSAGAHQLLALARAGAEVLEEAPADGAARQALRFALHVEDYHLAAECKAFLARTRRPTTEG